MIDFEARSLSTKISYEKKLLGTIIKGSVLAQIKFFESKDNFVIGKVGGEYEGQLTLRSFWSSSQKSTPRFEGLAPVILQMTGNLCVRIDEEVVVGIRIFMQTLRNVEKYGPIARVN